MNLSFIFENAFPVADAGANRLLSIAKGLVENGCNVRVFCVRPSERFPNIVNTQVEGEFEGVNYVYPVGTTIWPTSKIKRILIYYKGIYKSWNFMKKYNKQIKVDAIVSYCYSMPINIIFWLFSLMYSIKYVYFVDEYPNSVLYPQKYNLFSKQIEQKIQYRLFDIILVMTEPLKEYYTKRKNKSAIIEIISMTVQPERFESYKGSAPEKQPYLAYAGFLGDNKDGVDILIKAFGVVSKIFTDYFLYVIGYSNNRVDYEELESLAFEAGVYEKVIFTGKIHRNEIPRYFCNATALVLSRPDNIQAKGGFPTKLGEYLATGNPVIVTRVGEIPFYLKDGENAFLAEPGSVLSFAEKMIQVLENIQIAREVGLKGKELVYSVFNNKIQSKKIIDILNN